MTIYSESGQFKHQFLSFQLCIDARPWEAASYGELAEAIWNKNSVLLKAVYEALKLRHKKLEGYLVPYAEPDAAYDMEQWEICEDDFTEEARNGLACNCISFYRDGSPFSQAQAHLLTDLVKAVAAEVGAEHGADIQLVVVEVQTARHVTVTSLDSLGAA